MRTQSYKGYVIDYLRELDPHTHRFETSDISRVFMNMHPDEDEDAARRAFASVLKELENDGVVRTVRTIKGRYIRVVCGPIPAYESRDPIAPYTKGSASAKGRKRKKILRREDFENKEPHEIADLCRDMLDSAMLLMTHVQELAGYLADTHVQPNCDPETLTDKELWAEVQRRKENGIRIVSDEDQ